MKIKISLFLFICLSVETFAYSTKDSLLNISNTERSTKPKSLKNLLGNNVSRSHNDLLMDFSKFPIPKKAVKVNPVPFRFDEEDILDVVSSGIKSRLTRKRFLRYSKTIFIISQEFKLDPFFVLALCWTESSFNPEARSHVGASGLMQIMPRTRGYLKKGIRKEIPYAKRKELYSKLKDIELSKKIKEDIILANFYLSELKKDFGSMKLAAVAYNMGPTWVKRRLANNKPVGVKNQYLDKIYERYKKLKSNFESYMMPI